MGHCDCGNSRKQYRDTYCMLLSIQSLQAGQIFCDLLLFDHAFTIELHLRDLDGSLANQYVFI